MQDPKVSVIITTVGRDSLKDAVRSVQDQTFKDYELIVIEDRERRGGTWALNQGLDKAKGEYIAILDDDDTWVSKDKLEKQVAFLDNKKDYIAVGTNPQPGQGEEIKINLVGTPFPHSSILFRKGLKYDEKLPRGKDLDLMLRLSKLGKLAVIKDCFVNIYYKSGREELNNKISDCHYHRKVILLHKDFPNWLGIYLKLWARELKLRYYKVKNYFIRK
jgi:glycosyltransferase involved in cell wall biosynthesis